MHFISKWRVPLNEHIIGDGSTSDLKEYYIKLNNNKCNVDAWLQLLKSLKCKIEQKTSCKFDNLCIEIKHWH